MQTLTEKVAYLKGLAAGAKLNERGDTERILSEVISALDEFARAAEKADAEIKDAGERIDEIDEDLGALESDFYDGDSDGGECDDSEGEYEVECPRCRDRIILSEETAEKGEIECPNCGAELRFDLNDAEEAAEDNR